MHTCEYRFLKDDDCLLLAAIALLIGCTFPFEQINIFYVCLDSLSYSIVLFSVWDPKILRFNLISLYKLLLCEIPHFNDDAQDEQSSLEQPNGLHPLLKLLQNILHHCA